MERRTIASTISLETRGDDPPAMIGHAAVFNSRSADMGWGLTEIVAPGAFSKTLQERDVIALWNHETGKVMGSTRGGNLTLTEDDQGLAFELRGPFEGFAAEVASVRGGHVTGVSFGFRAIRDTYDYEETEAGETVTRTLREVELFEISPTAFPAYPTTDVAVRTAHAAALALERPSVFWNATRHAGIDAAELRGMNLSPIALGPLAQPDGTDMVSARSIYVEHAHRIL